MTTSNKKPAGWLGTPVILKSLRDERGAALIAVLCFVVLVALLTASAVTLSQVGSYTSRTFADRSISAYISEGAAARVQWLVIADKKKFTSRILGETEYAAEVQERFMADGVQHKIDYYGIEIDVMINDMASGYDISDDNPSRQLESFKNMFYDNDEMQKDFNVFIDCLKDYTDADDFPQLNGKERTDYERLGLYPLPRNGKMQFREEIMLIPDFDKFFQPDMFGRLTSFKIISPPTMPRIGQGNSFFSASKDVIMSKCSFSSVQADKVMEARNQWINERIPLNQTLDLGILGTLKGAFSFNESGFFTIIVNASPGQGRAKRVLAVSMQIPTNITLPGIRYYEWILY
ncbi:MAG: hypothetical protein A2X45_06460 [Lentisphaerae bacterium GWF2_50_93]|nr:MAG: hypothetical protein A2X45_06460 [Lentisphaerae bacterium GWF2_50_93]